MDRLPKMTPQEARRDHAQMLRYLAVNAVFGMGVGIVVGLALIWLDPGGIGTRIGRSQNWFLSAFILLAPLAFTFGGAVAASSIMVMPYQRKYREPREDRTEEK